MAGPEMGRPERAPGPVLNSILDWPTVRAFPHVRNVWSKESFWGFGKIKQFAGGLTIKTNVVDAVAGA